MAFCHFTNPESSEGSVCGLRQQTEEVRQVGQCVSLDAVKHYAGQPGRCQPFLWFLQEASYPDSYSNNRFKSIRNVHLQK